MTATDVATVTPTEAAAEASTSKETSPVKEVTKTPEQVKDEAATLIACGKRYLLLNNIPDAVTHLADACSLLSKQFGETATECAEGYFYYGKSLLELSRMESGVLGNALEGVPEEEAEGNTSQFEDPSKMTDQEKNEVTDNVTEALEANFKDLEDKKKPSETKEAENKAETKEGEKSAESAEKESEEAEKPKEGSEAEKPKESSEAAASSSTEAKEEEDDSAMEEDEETGDEDAEESSDEKKEEETEKKDEEEEPSNLQLAWEMLELAKVVYTKQLEAETGDKTQLLERLCSTMLALGEVSIENENYKQAVEDILECLKKTESLAKDSRIIAEIHYQLGVAQGFHAQHDDAVKSLENAISIIKERITNMSKVETDDAKKEVKELEALIPEIEEKINDTKDMKKEAESKEDGASSSGDTAIGSSKVDEVKPVSSIAVKRKAEEEDSSNKKLAAEPETAAAS